MKSISGVFQRYGYNCIVISDSCSGNNNFLKLENHWNPPISNAVKIYDMIIKVSLPDILFIEFNDENPNYEVLFKEQIIDKLVILCDSSKYIFPLALSALSKEDIISIDLTAFNDDTELAELIYSQIAGVYT
ncbi:hypothetical protein FHR92_000723 [Fontibacillus solani]|uniref:Uncharacterized protein n=1 Tax=Fontibacillus solani TaxID=1572857 RepID=A0A7W3SQL8_9BACL|nr:hypothetical protein [Fontibacillus solani]MBA9084269.1 hypothetical protein [Fontibacillus solani]